MDFPDSSDSEASAYNAGDPGSIPGSGRSPGEGNGNLLQYSCLENPMDGGTWWATVHGVAKSQTRLSDLAFTFKKTSGFPGGSNSEEYACSVGDPGLISGEENGNPFQYSCLGNPMDRGAFWSTVHGVTKSLTALNNEHFHFQGDMTSKNAMGVLTLDTGAEDISKKFW